MPTPSLSISRRTRSTAFTSRLTDHGVSAYTVYNHMLLPTVFESVEADYWHLCQKVQVWDVSAERQVEIKGPDAARLVQLMTPRNIAKAKVGRCFYLPLCDEQGKLLNDPVGLKLAKDHWWLSLADSDILLWAKGLATGFGLDVALQEPDISPLAIQGPLAEDLTAKVLGEDVRNIRFFRFKHITYQGHNMVVARSGWSKQGGFEVYISDANTGRALWDELFEKGKTMDVKAGCPNLIERIESGLLSFGNDMDLEDTPFDCGLDRYVSLDADIDSLSIKALRQIAKQPAKQLIGLVLDEKLQHINDTLQINDKTVGEVRSHAWSPKYQRHLALAMCNRALIKGHSEGKVETNLGLKSASFDDVPFDFIKLGLKANPA